MGASQFLIQHNTKEMSAWEFSDATTSICSLDLWPATVDWLASYLPATSAGVLSYQIISQPVARMTSRCPFKNILHLCHAAIAETELKFLGKATGINTNQTHCGVRGAVFKNKEGRY